MCFLVVVPFCSYFQSWGGAGNQFSSVNMDGILVPIGFKNPRGSFYSSECSGRQVCLAGVMN